MPRLRTALVFALTALATFVATAAPVTNPADTLSPVAAFNRCYGTIARRRLPPSHRYYEAVRDKDMTPIDACMQVLKDSMFGAASPDADEQTRVVQTFSDFHRRWFSADNYFSTLPVGELYTTAIRLIHDPAEPAHYVTRSMFKGVPFQTVVNEASGMRAVRSPNQPEGQMPGAGLPKVAWNNGTTALVPYDPPYLMTGDVVDVQRIAEKPDHMGVVLNPVAGWPQPIPIYQHMGGGILGSQSFLMLNFGRGIEDNDGGLRVPRRWSKAVLTDLLCRDVPAIRLTDAEPFVEPTHPNLPFRKSASCMQCHATLDPMADAARNLRYFAFNYNQVEALSTIFMVQRNVANTRYDDSAPTGKLFFRSYNGDLVDTGVTGLPELGKSIAEGDDLYVCAASRYFEFFTGLRVSLQDLGDPSTVALSAADKAYREQVIAMGLKFKEHQNVMTLIKDVMSSDFYQSAGMRKSVKVE